MVNNSNNLSNISQMMMPRIAESHVDIGSIAPIYPEKRGSISRLNIYRRQRSNSETQVLELISRRTSLEGSSQSVPNASHSHNRSMHAGRRQSIVLTEGRSMSTTLVRSTAMHESQLGRRNSITVEETTGKSLQQRLLKYVQAQGKSLHLKYDAYSLKEALDFMSNPKKFRHLNSEKQEWKEITNYLRHTEHGKHLCTTYLKAQSNLSEEIESEKEHNIEERFMKPTQYITKSGNLSAISDNRFMRSINTVAYLPPINQQITRRKSLLSNPNRSLLEGKQELPWDNIQYCRYISTSNQSTNSSPNCLKPTTIHIPS